MLHYTDLENVLLHSKLAKDCDRLIAISGYVGPEIVKELADFPRNTHFKIVYGMYGSDNISEPMHKKFVELQNALPNVDIYYSTVPIHSKIYCWSKENGIKRTLMGSANFTISGLRRDYKEILSDVETESIPDCIEYFNYVLDKCLLCTDSRITLKRQKKHHCEDVDLQTQPYISEGICRASLLSRGKEVAALSGLNWGLAGIGDRTSHTALGDAYIAITKEYLRLFPDLFPIKKYVNGKPNLDSKGKPNRENDEVELIWDDGASMIGLMEGQQTLDGSIYPKQLSTSPKKNILGCYLRKRLNVSLTHQITKADLLRYGRVTIDISKLGEGIYYMDFSV